MAFRPDLIDRLFARFGAMYGNRFLDMWREIDIVDVKKCWVDELSKFAIGDIGKAVGDLKANNFPPTLPEFLQLCEKAKGQRESLTIRTNYPVLPPASIKTETEYIAAQQRCMEAVRNLKFAPANKAWAYKNLKRAENKEHEFYPAELALSRKVAAEDHGRDDPFRKASK